jgi:hypothetical protein
MPASSYSFVLAKTLTTMVKVHTSFSLSDTNEFEIKKGSDGANVCFKFYIRFKPNPKFNFNG